MFRSILPQPSYDHLFSNEPASEGGEGGGGSGGGGGGEGKPAEQGLSKAEVDNIVKGRVEETRKKTTTEIAEQLGVSVEEAKQIIADAKAKSDAEKSDAQRAREAADKEKADAEAEKTAAALAKHEAKVERQLLRALPKDLDDTELDKRAAKLSRLIDVEVGADDATIKTAVDDLKKDWPELFPAAEGEGKGKPPRAPGSDPAGKPPVQRGTEDAYARGQERAKKTSKSSGYAILDKQTA